MAKFQGPKSHIHPIARGLLVRGQEIILCRGKDAKWFFLPGGHKDYKILPTALKNGLLEWLKDGKPFFKEI